MTMHLRERRSHAREFIEVPPTFRHAVADAIEALIAVLDQLDQDTAPADRSSLAAKATGDASAAKRQRRRRLRLAWKGRLS